MINPKFKKLIEENTREEFERKFSVLRVSTGDYRLVNIDDWEVCDCPYEQECPYECSCGDCWNNAYQLILINFKEENK